MPKLLIFLNRWYPVYVLALIVAAFAVVAITLCRSTPPSVAVPTAPTAITTPDGRTITVPPGSNIEISTHTTKTGAVTSKTTDRSANYIDWSSAASVAGALAENVDWGAMLKGPLGIILGAAGVGTLGVGKLIHSNGKSKGRNEIRAATHKGPTP